MEFLYQAPYAKLVDFKDSKPHGTRVYKVQVDQWKNRFNDRSKEPYKTLPGDLLVLANAKPETFSDLDRSGRSWTFLSVTKIREDDRLKNKKITEDQNEGKADSCCTYFKVKASKKFELEIETQTSLFVVFLGNLTTNKRIWKSLHISRHPTILDDVLCCDSGVSF
ncbi:hypothetical protein TorRG33x02_283410 [Trema orientale]|uniref:DUF6469 domain-containing protein n=1 Tax=Trema orientale TaxID=63057 RepID=A0A2P5CIP6_TREOI|nr:hypothetical protein TorRG33x02_283410 [Trema orientale]